MARKVRIQYPGAIYHVMNAPRSVKSNVLSLFKAHRHFLGLRVTIVRRQSRAQGSKMAVVVIDLRCRSRGGLGCSLVMGNSAARSDGKSAG
jgi:hypothetical protein